MTQNMIKKSEQTIDTAVKEHGKRIIESLLFSSSEPVALKKLKEILDTAHSFSTSEVKEMIDSLQKEYTEQNRAFQIEEIAKGYLLRTREKYNHYIRLLLKSSRPDRLSNAALEVLAIIVYRQPITRPQIDAIRGVDSSGILHTLMDRQLIEPSGRLEVPGRPTLYSITSQFLQHFGLKDKNDLPIPKQLQNPNFEIESSMQLQQQ